MRLIHFANFNSTNIGNGALISGTERVLREDLGAIEIIQEAWDDYTFGIKPFDQKLVDLINSSDGLIIGAAVTLNGQVYQTETGTRFELPLSLWKQIKKPIIFYGISHRHWPNQKYHNIEKLKGTMRYIQNNPNIIFSVRNDGTKEWLEDIVGFTIPKMKVIPDPALFLTTTDSYHPELMSDRKNIILALNNEDEVYRFGGRIQLVIWKLFGHIISEKRLLHLFKKLPKWDHHKKAFLSQVAKALEVVSKKYPVNIILAPHYFDDFKAISEFIPLCPLRFPHQNIISTGMARVRQTGYFYDLYAKADLAISMRVHSMSPAIGLNTPMIALTTQSRLTEFLRTAGLGAYDIHALNKDLTSELSQKVDFVLNNKGSVQADFKNAVAKMRQEIRDFNKELGEFLNRR